MSTELIKALEALGQRFLTMVTKDDDVRAGLRALAQVILSATAEAPRPTPAREEPEVQQPAPPPRVEAVSPPVSAPAPAIQPDGPRVSEPTPAAVPRALVPPSSAGHGEEVPAANADVRPRQWFTTFIPPDDADLPLIEARCRLKAEGARWAATRRRKLAEGADFRMEIDPHDRDIIGRAKQLPDCFLWMNHPSGPLPADLSLLDVVAGCFEATANALALVSGVMGGVEKHQDVIEQALHLTAEAQSSLRAAINAIDGPTDPDQVQVFVWLKTTAEEQRIYIPRFMRIDDMADPTRWADLDARITAARGQREDARKRAQRHKNLLGKVRYSVQKITSGKEAGQHDYWRSLVTAVDELVQAGVPPSNREIRELLLPVLDDMPELEDRPKGFDLVLREIDRYLDSRPAVAEAVSRPERSPAVAEVARLLAGQSIVLIGGERSPTGQEALKTSLGLKEVYWIETREHQSLEGFEPYIARPDVALVILAIRWSSHSYGDVKLFCERHSKPLVRLPAGYSVNQVAQQILAQCSERLARTS
jgi:hypothetical protein